MMRKYLAGLLVLPSRLIGSDEAAPFECSAYVNILQLAQLSLHGRTFLVTSDCHCCTMDPCLVTAENSPACPDDKQVRIYLRT
jgi:hypothetical protein